MTAAIDLVEAIGIGNVTQATRHVAEAEKGKLLTADGASRRPPTTIMVLTRKGAKALLDKAARQRRLAENSPRHSPATTRCSTDR